MGDPIDELIEEIIVDAYGEHEQLWSFRQVFEDEARFPFRGRVVGVEVEVASVDFDGDERRGLIAVCRRAGEVHTVSLLEVIPEGPLPLRTRQLLDAYRRWSGATPLTPMAPDQATPWVYPRFASVTIGMRTPLALQPMGAWNPTEEYWGEPDQPLDPLSEEIFAAGMRPCFEMEQILPGVEPDDWDTDPIVDAANLHRAGYHGEAIRLLEGLLAIETRCIDAWAHLGLISFDTKGPGAAAKLYETGVAVAERSLPEGFAGVLPWGMVDNRPFLRCLHGLALCAWRQRRWDDAEAMLTARVWLDPTGPLDALACLAPVRARTRWTRP
ncbi:MAG: calcium-binding protein [Acidimicrobiales bacterium]